MHSLSTGYHLPIKNEGLLQKRYYIFQYGNASLTCAHIRCPPFNFRGGGLKFFVAGKLFISTGLDGALKIWLSITCLYRTVLVIFLFHSESARNYLFKKKPQEIPPPLEI